MAISMDAALGWAAIGKIGHNIPEIVTIRSVVIREPNENVHYKGSIYLMLDMTEDRQDSALLRLFGHKPEGLEPRLYRLPYNRKFHEELQKDVIPRLMKGQTVTGKLKKGGGKGGEGEGAEGDFDGNGDGQGNGHGGRRGGQRGQGQGAGGDDRDTEFHFYELPPSYFHPKEG